MAKVVRCRECRLPLSASLDTVVDGNNTNDSDGAPFVHPGQYHVSDGGYFTGTEGRYIINLMDRRNVTDHSDPKRLAGCCGRDGTKNADAWEPVRVQGAIWHCRDIFGDTALMPPGQPIGAP